MSPINLEPSDSKMADRWHMQTEFMLQRVPSSDLKRMVDDIKDGINYQVDQEGNIVESELSPIDRDKSELNDRICEKVREAKKPVEEMREKLEELEKERELPGMKKDEKERSAKIQVLEEILEEVDPNHG